MVNPVVKSLWTEDDLIVARLSSVIGHLVSPPGAITVSAWNGHVTLRGRVFADELGGVLARARHLPGVRVIDNQLELQTRADGGRSRRRIRHPQARHGWSTGSKLAVGMAGGIGVGVIAWALRPERGRRA